MSVKVLILKSRLGFPGGLEKITLSLAKAFAHTGANVTIATTFDSKAPPLQSEHFDVRPLFQTKNFSPHQLIAFDRASRSLANKFDIVFGMERTSFQTHLRAGFGVHRALLQKKAKTESFFERVFHKVSPRDYLNTYFERKAFENPCLKTLFVNSEMVKKEILENYEVPPHKIQVVHNGVDWEGSRESFENSFIKRGDQFELLFIGNGFKRKNLDTLLSALSLIPESKIHLSIVGGDKSLPSYQEKASHLRQRVTFYGIQRDLAPFYARADCLVLPTLYDPFANVTLEALAMGLYVITTSTNGASEILNSSHSTIVKNSLSRHELAQAIEKSMRESKSYEKAFARRESVRHLDFSSQLTKITQITLSDL